MARQPRAKMTPPVVFTEREIVVARVAEDYHFLATPAGKSGDYGSGEGYPRPDMTYTRTVREFEHLMRQMRKNARSQHHGHRLGDLYRHVLGWYVESQPVRKQAFLRVTGRGNRIPHVDELGVPLKPRRGDRLLRHPSGDLVRVSVVTRRRDPSSRRDLADLGVRWVAGRFPFDPVHPYDELAEK